MSAEAELMVKQMNGETICSKYVIFFSFLSLLLIYRIVQTEYLMVNTVCAWLCLADGKGCLALVNKRILTCVLCELLVWNYGKGFILQLIRLKTGSEFESRKKWWDDEMVQLRWMHFLTGIGSFQQWVCKNIIQRVIDHWNMWHTTQSVCAIYIAAWEQRKNCQSYNMYVMMCMYEFDCLLFCASQLTFRLSCFWCHFILIQSSVSNVLAVCCGIIFFLVNFSAIHWIEYH